MIAEMAQISELYVSASVTQIALSLRDHERVENVTPPQNDACIVSYLHDVLGFNQTRGHCSARMGSFMLSLSM
jgi:hypothetical protein